MPPHPSIRQRAQIPVRARARGTICLARLSSSTSYASASPETRSESSDTPAPPWKLVNGRITRPRASRSQRRGASVVAWTRDTIVQQTALGRSVERLLLVRVCGPVSAAWVLGCPAQARAALKPQPCPSSAGACCSPTPTCNTSTKATGSA